MTELNFINDVIYALKQEYGNPGIITSIISEETNIDSGVISRTVRQVPVIQMIFLPNILARRFFKQSLAYDIRNRAILIDTNDLGNLELKVKDYITYDEKSWEINNISTFEDQALVLEVTEFLGYPPESITVLTDTLTLGDTNGLS